MTLIGRLLAGLKRRRRAPRPALPAPLRVVDRGQLDDLRLRACRLEECRGVCCKRGARTTAGEAARITDLMQRHPELFSALPRVERYLVPRDALGQPGAYSTEVVSDSSLGRLGLQSANVAGREPTAEDMEGSHCVFRYDDGRCSLQVAAEALGEHKWQYKPLGCWLFPLTVRVVEKRADETLVCLEHAAIAKAKPDRSMHPCGMLRADGEPAKQVLREEIEYFVRRKCAVDDA